MLALGLAFRLILAHQLPGSGFENDLLSFQGWAANLASQGPFGFYDRPFFHDYTPGYLYVLWLVGIVGGFLGGIGDLIKLPAILADIALAALAWSMARELGAGRRAALIGAALVVVNPVTWFDSVVWGQVDSFGVVFLLLALRELWRDRPERAAILTVVAALIKPQLGILVPIVAAVTIRRALWPAGGYGDEPGPIRGPRDTTTAWERTTHGPLRILTTGIAGFVTAIALSAPFGLSLPGLIGQIFSTAAGYPYVSVNAYNPWALVSLDGTGVAANSGWVCDAVAPATAAGPDCSTGVVFGAIPALVVGSVLLVAAMVVVSLLVARRPDRRTILVGLIVLALAFFVLPTRVHERYLFPFFALAAIPAAFSFRWRLAYVLVAAATFANMYVVLTTLYPDNPNVEDWLGIGGGIRSWTGVAVIALVHTGALAWAAVQLRDGALARLGREVEATAGGQADVDDEVDESDEERDEERDEAGAEVGAVHEAPPLPAIDPVAAPLAARSVSVEAAEPPAYPVWDERPSLAEAGAWGWFRARLFDRPVHADRSRALHGEGGGRLDRLDLWLVAVLVVSALVLRTWRLAEPYQMHFDEVYHARTATEFLQDWRYGLSHDIYEWTHPHLAKYAMAGGLVAWGDDRVHATSELGVPVRAAVVEPRWEDLANAAARNGDRLHVVTGSELRSYDLATRRLVATVSIPGAVALALDRTEHRLFVGTSDGQLLDVSTLPLDEQRSGGETASPSPEPFASVGASVGAIHVTDDGEAVLAATADGRVVTIDAATGSTTGQLTLADAVQFADAGRQPAVVATADEVTDVDAVASELATLLGGTADDYANRLTSGETTVVLGTVPSDRAALDEAISGGRLPGVQVRDVARVAVANASGITFVLPAAGTQATTIAVAGGAQGVVEVTGVDDPKLYATSNGNGPAFQVIDLGQNGTEANPSVARTQVMPGRVGLVAYDQATQQVHILGSTPATEGSPSAPTVYVVEPHANAVYADARLPAEPAAWAMDENQLYPAADRQELIVLSADGAAATIDVGQHAFAWRLPGVLAGAAMAALLYLLARILFRRRAVAVVVALLTLADGMLFVQSRIGMNDAYVGLFIVAAYVLFAALWTGRWSWRGAFWVAMPAIGLLLGLALASKWVAAYAIGALGILILARSALGRIVLVAGMIVVTTVLGYLAISVPAGQSGGNLTFALIMIALTLVAVLVTVLHPIAWTDDEARFAIAAPAVAGAAIALIALPLGAIDRRLTFGPFAFTPFLAGFALVVLAVLVAIAFWLAGRWGFGPFAAPPAPDDPVALVDPPAPPAEGWLRIGSLAGLPVVWMIVCLIGLPLAVYVASYIPWALIENHRIVAGWPPGHTGQTLLELTGQMYNYHNTLSSPHAASSPWWAWPFDLKPVWFYQESFAGGTAASVYDAGNLALWWLGVPAMAFAAWQAFQRRSLGLALIAIGFAAQWISWARIDRAAFQYHYYTSLPFVVLALAYFLAELWHGASRRTWLLARLAAAAAIVGPAALWLFHRPLCGFVRVDAVNPNSQACPTIIPEAVLTGRTALLAVVLGVAAIVVLRQVLGLRAPRLTDDPDRSEGDDLAAVEREAGALWRQFRPLLVAALATGLLVLGVTLFNVDVTLIALHGVAVEPIAIVLALPLLFVAAFVATARDARRFVVGALSAIVAVFVVFYPNIAALPLPSAIVNMYQGVLPTYVYPFQFPVSTVDRNVAGPPLLAPEPAILLVALTIACLVVGYSGWVWRIALAERRLAALERDADATLAARGGEA